MAGSAARVKRRDGLSPGNRPGAIQLPAATFGPFSADGALGRGEARGWAVGLDG